VIARNYGVMVRHFPVAGGEFAYAYYAAGRYHAYICGWFLALGYLSIVPLNATALAVLGKFVMPGAIARGHLYSVAGFEVFAGEVALASLAILFFGYVQYRGVKAVGAAQLTMSLVLVGAVCLITLGTLGYEGSSFTSWQPYFPPERSPLAAILAMIAIAPWLYVGFDTLPQAAEEIAFSPARTLRLMVIAILAGAAMYLMVLLSTAAVIPWQTLVGEHLAWSTGTTVSTSLGTTGLAFLTLAVCMGVFTGINGFFMACSRLLFSMSRARILPAWFSHVHPTQGTPTKAILFTGAVSLLAPWFGRQVILWVVAVASLGTAIGYLYTCVATYLLVGRTPALAAGFKEKAYPVLGALFAFAFVVLLCVPGMPAFMVWPSWIALAGWVTLGILFYASRAAEFRRLSGSELDYLILAEKSEARSGRTP
jgi:amino acid transporter